jgi:hypothetical protein
MMEHETTRLSVRDDVFVDAIAHLFTVALALILIESQRRLTSWQRQ